MNIFGRSIVTRSLIGSFILSVGLLDMGALNAQPSDAGHSHKHESAIRVLVDKLPPDRDIVYVSSYASVNPPGGGDGNVRNTAVVKAMKQDGTEKTSILEVEGIQIYSVRPSPSGEALLFTVGEMSGENGENAWLNSHIWIYRNGKVTQLTSGMVRDLDIIWSPLANKIYFTRNKISVLENDVLKSEEGDVWSINPDGSELRQLTFSTKENLVNIAPVPTADGKKIVFTTNRNSKWQIFTMNPNGSNQKLFISDGMQGNWSPNGEILAYLDGSPGDVYLADKKGRLIKKLTTEHKVPFAPSWSPDGKYLLYSRFNGAVGERVPEGAQPDGDTPEISTSEEPLFDIWKMPMDGKGSAERLTSEGLINSFAFWIPSSSK